MKIAANLKEGFTGKALMNDAIGALAAPLYCLPASFLKVNGWLGFLMAFGVPYLAGKLLKVPALSIAAVGIAAAHMVYYFGNDTVKGFNGNQGMWRLTATDANSAPLTTGTTVTGLSYIPSGAQMQRLPSGQEVIAYPAGNGVNDYLRSDNLAMNDYLRADNIALNDYVDDSHLFLNDDLDPYGRF